jgi:serine protease Do
MSALQELEASIEDAAARVGPAVVGLGRGWGVGSGVVIDTGRVVTNAHNLRHGHEEVTVTFVDGRRATGHVAGTDPDLDVAVITVDTGDVTPVVWEPAGEATGAKLGRAVLAHANPGGRGLRVTPGFISAAARSFRGPRGRRIAGAIEHTAPLPRGSSGGPLTDLEGRLLGLNTVRADGGLILAIPADASFREKVDALGRGDAPRRVRLGVAIVPPRAARKLRHAVGLPERDGVLVRGVEDGSPAANAGVERGDLIVSAGGRQLDRIDALYEALDGARETGSLVLTIVRGVEERTVTVEL